MDAKNVSEIIMNDDSEFSDFSDSSDEEYDDLNLCDRSDSDSGTDTIQVPMQSPVEQPGPSQLRAMQLRAMQTTKNGKTDSDSLFLTDKQRCAIQLEREEAEKRKHARKLENIALHALSQQHTARTYKRKLSALQTG